MNSSLKRKKSKDFEDFDDNNFQKKYFKFDEDTLSDSIKSLNIKPKRRLPMTFFIDKPTVSIDNSSIKPLSNIKRKKRFLDIFTVDEVDGDDEDSDNSDTNNNNKMDIKMYSNNNKINNNKKRNYEFETNLSKTESDLELEKNLDTETDSDFPDIEFTESEMDYDTESDSETNDKFDLYMNTINSENSISEYDNSDLEDIEEDLPTEFKSEEFVYDTDEDSKYNEDYLAYKLKKSRIN